MKMNRSIFSMARLVGVLVGMATGQAVFAESSRTLFETSAYRENYFNHTSDDGALRPLHLSKNGEKALLITTDAQSGEFASIRLIDTASSRSKMIVKRNVIKLEDGSSFKFHTVDSASMAPAGRFVLIRGTVLIPRSEGATKPKFCAADSEFGGNGKNGTINPCALLIDLDQPGSITELASEFRGLSSEFPDIPQTWETGYVFSPDGSALLGAAPYAEYVTTQSTTYIKRQVAVLRYDIATGTYERMPEQKNLPYGLFGFIEYVTQNGKFALLSSESIDGLEGSHPYSFVVMNLTTGEQMEFAGSKQQNRGLWLSEDGREAILTGGKSHFRRVNVFSEESINLDCKALESVGAVSPMITPNGKNILFEIQAVDEAEQLRVNNSLVSLNTTTKRCIPIVVPRSNNAETGVAVSLEGRKIAYIEATRIGGTDNFRSWKVKLLNSIKGLKAK